MNMENEKVVLIKIALKYNEHIDIIVREMFHKEYIESLLMSMGTDTTFLIKSEDVYDESNSKIFFNAQNIQMISSKTLEYNENMKISELHHVDVDEIIRMKIKES